MMYTAIYNANSPSRCSVEFVNCTPRVFLLLSSPFFFNTEPAIGCRDDDGSVAITAAGLEEHAPIFISLPGGWAISFWDRRIYKCGDFSLRRGSRFRPLQTKGLEIEYTLMYGYIRDCY